MNVMAYILKNYLIFILKNQNLQSQSQNAKSSKSNSAYVRYIFSFVFHYFDYIRINVVYNGKRSFTVFAALKSKFVVIILIIPFSEF